MILIAIGISFLVLRFVLSLFNLHQLKLQLSAIPQAPHDSFFQGHAPTLNKAKEDNTFLELFMKWTEEHGDTVLFWLNRRPFIFSSDPTILQQVTTELTKYKKVEKLPNRSLFQQKIVGLNSILSGGGVMWATKRKIMSKWFAKTNMETLFNVCKPHMAGSQMARLRTKVGSGKTIEMIDELGIIFSSYIHVLGCSELFTAEKIAKNVAKILEMIPLQLGFNMRMLKAKFSGEKGEVIAMIKEMRSKIQDLAWEKIQEVENTDNVDAHDILAHLCQANQNVNMQGDRTKLQASSMTNQSQNIVDDVMTICLVLDNMVKQIGSLFIQLKENPKAKDKLFKELRQNPITDFKSLQNLKYTEKCLLESLRVSPALLRGTRTTSKVTRFGPYAIPNMRIQIFYSQYVLHHNKMYWTNPYEFNPDRWSPDFVPEPYSYIPFFVGPRSCIGKHFAMFCMKLTLSVLVNNFDFTPKFDPEKPPAVDQSMAVMRIKNNIDYMITPRQ